MTRTRKVAAALAGLLLPLGLLAGCGSDEPVHPSGTFEATEVDLSPRLAGQLLRVGADEGDRVSAGDTLLVVDTDLIRLRRAETTAGIAAVEARARAQRDEVAQAARGLALAETTLTRLRTMVAAGNATRQRVDEATAQRDIAAQKVQAARHGVQSLEAEADRLHASLAVLDRQLADGVLVAPLDGTVLQRTAEPGEMAAPGRTALRLADLTRLDLRFYLDETDLDLVKLGQSLEVVVDALPGRTFSGRVIWISDEAEFTPKNAQTRDARAQLVYAVKLRVANPDGVLSIGMPADVVVAGGRS